MLKENKNLRSLLLVLVLFAFPKSNAMPLKDVNSFCKETRQADLCLKHFGSDKRIVAARDFSDVFLIAATDIQIQVNNGLTHINNVRGTYNDPLVKKRLGICEEKYMIAANRFHKASEVGRKKSMEIKDRMELSDHMKAGIEAVRDCERQWSKDGPIKQSPLNFYDHNVLNLGHITMKVIGKIYEKYDQQQRRIHVKISGAPAPAPAPY